MDKQDILERVAFYRDASELGTAREVVSRILESFERQGVIGLSRGRIVVRDIPVLEAFG